MIKIEINGLINILTGIHIGGNANSNNIGGIDHSVIKTIRRRKNDNGEVSNNYEPYIPGSSLRGKLRSLLEQSEGKDLGGSDSINELFGYVKTDNEKTTITKSSLIVYDSFLNNDSEEKLRESEYLDMPYTEEKVENKINRVTGASDGGLRHIERVPAGVSFEFKMLLTAEDIKGSESQLKLIKKGINLLELDYLGGNGSRGYGKIEFSKLMQKVYTIEDEISEGESTTFNKEIVKK